MHKDSTRPENRTCRLSRLAPKGQGKKERIVLWISGRESLSLTPIRHFTWIVEWCFNRQTWHRTRQLDICRDECRRSNSESASRKTLNKQFCHNRCRFPSAACLGVKTDIFCSINIQRDKGHDMHSHALPASTLAHALLLAFCVWINTFCILLIVVLVNYAGVSLIVYWCYTITMIHSVLENVYELWP